MYPQFESILPPETNSFKAEVQRKKEFDFPYHYHPNYELTYILSSDGVRYVGNEFDNFRENDLIFLGPNLPHCWKNTNCQSTVASALVIQWKEDLLGKEWLETKELAAVKKLHHLSSKGIHFSPKVAISLKKDLLQITDADPFRKLMMLLEILNTLALSNDYNILCKRDYTNNTNLIDSERINTVYQFVKNNYMQKITLQTIASTVFMSEESFSRFFSKIMKKTFFSFLNEYRINMACKLLIETEQQIAQVCYSSGYETIPFFYRQFKKFKNCSPQFYRSQFKLTGNFSIPTV
jgi:AraC-like DNA-binding protein/mannose-6-phosphate isomerase-like protein (cupin superfamily)